MKSTIIPKILLATTLIGTAYAGEVANVTVPGKFVHAEFMFKDATKYKDSGGWGWARWKGTDQKPYGKTADFWKECYGCHLPVKGRDLVFTTPAIIP